MNLRRISIAMALGGVVLAGCEHRDDRTSPAGRIAQRPQQVYIGAAPPSAPPYTANSAIPSGLLGIGIAAAIVFVAATAFVLVRIGRKNRST